MEGHLPSCRETPVGSTEEVSEGPATATPFGTYLLATPHLCTTAAPELNDDAP